jgi:hypothetical protein
VVVLSEISSTWQPVWVWVTGSWCARGVPSACEMAYKLHGVNRSYAE